MGRVENIGVNNINPNINEVENKRAERFNMLETIIGLNPSIEHIEILELWSGTEFFSTKSVLYHLVKNLWESNIKTGDGACIKIDYYIANNCIYFVWYMKLDNWFMFYYLDLKSTCYWTFHLILFVRFIARCPTDYLVMTQQKRVRTFTMLYLTIYSENRL